MPPPRQVTKCRNEDIQQSRNCEVDYLSGRTGADGNRTEAPARRLFFPKLTSHRFR